MFLKWKQTHLRTMFVPFSSGLAGDKWCLSPSNLPKLVERCGEDLKNKKERCHKNVSQDLPALHNIKSPSVSRLKNPARLVASSSDKITQKLL